MPILPPRGYKEKVERREARTHALLKPSHSSTASVCRLDPCSALCTMSWRPSTKLQLNKDGIKGSCVWKGAVKRRRRQLVCGVTLCSTVLQFHRCPTCVGTKGKNWICQCWYVDLTPGTLLAQQCQWWLLPAFLTTSETATWSILSTRQHTFTLGMGVQGAFTALVMMRFCQVPQTFQMPQWVPTPKLMSSEVSGKWTALIDLSIQPVYTLYYNLCPHLPIHKAPYYDSIKLIV